MSTITSSIELLVDPRIKLLSVGKLEILAAQDSAGKSLKIQPEELKYPGQPPQGTPGAGLYGMQSISNRI